LLADVIATHNSSRLIKAVASFCDRRQCCQGRARGEPWWHGATAVVYRQNRPLASAKNFL